MPPESPGGPDGSAGQGSSADTPDAPESSEGPSPGSSAAPSHPPPAPPPYPPSAAAPTPSVPPPPPASPPAAPRYPPPYPSGSLPPYPSAPPHDAAPNGNAYPPPPPGYGSPYGAPPPQWGPGHAPPVSPYATYGRRLGGWLIDLLITNVIVTAVVIPLGDVHSSDVSGTQSSFPSVSGQGILLAILIVLIYGTAFIGSRRAQTPGMMAVGARAVDATTGQPIGHARALGRAVCEYVFIWLLFLPWIVDMLFPLWDARRQTLHDKVTNTVVVRTT